MKHTKGPWKSVEQIARDAIGLFLEYQYAHGKEEKEATESVIREFAEAGIAYEQDPLFATAPELLAFAKKVLAEQEAHGEAGDAALISEATNLIAKAEGEDNE